MKTPKINETPKSCWWQPHYAPHAGLDNSLRHWYVIRRGVHDEVQVAMSVDGKVRRFGTVEAARKAAGKLNNPKVDKLPKA